MKKLKILDLFSDDKVWADAKGYACVWINGKSKKCHVLTWESANGKKPNGYDIHHIDENKFNYSLENLELLSHSDHQKVHAGWTKEGGGWAKKPCTKCGLVLSLDCFYPRKNLTPTTFDSGNPLPPRKKYPGGGQKEPLVSVIGGKLNPQFVEWMMGFPMNWTLPSEYENKESSNLEIA